jgi:hypothetical protein
MSAERKMIRELISSLKENACEASRCLSSPYSIDKVDCNLCRIGVSIEAAEELIKPSGVADEDYVDDLPDIVGVWRDDEKQLHAVHAGLDNMKQPGIEPYMRLKRNYMPAREDRVRMLAQAAEICPYDPCPQGKKVNELVECVECRLDFARGNGH